MEELDLSKVKIQALDKDKVYLVTLECGDRTQDDSIAYIERIKLMFDKYDIKAIYACLHHGQPQFKVEEIEKILADMKSKK